MEKKENKMQNVYNLVIMDKSGSMESIRKYAIDGFNELLNGVRKTAEEFKDSQKQMVSLVLFDTSSIDTLAWNEDPAKVKHLDNKTYVPCACTPLYDAMGMALTRLKKEIGDDKEASVMVTVITDGLENASKEYSLGDIKALVSELKDKGWNFAYMGTDHDVTSVTVELNIGNFVNFSKDAAGTADAFAKEARARARYSRKWKDFIGLNSCASEAEIRSFKEKLNSEYYKEDEDTGADKG